MARPTNEERDRRAREVANQGNPNHLDGLLQGAQDHWDRMNELDERAPDRRPATPVNIMVDPIETAPDNRQPADDMGKAVNQMVGRAAITENDNPLPHTRPMPPVLNPHGPAADVDGGMEVQLTRGYQPEDGPKRVAGEIMQLKSKEAKRLVNLGAARFPEER